MHCVPGSAYSQDVEKTSNSLSISNLDFELVSSLLLPAESLLHQMQLCTLRVMQAKNLRRNTLRKNHCSGVLADQPLSKGGHGISTGLRNRR